VRRAIAVTISLVAACAAAGCAATREFETPTGPHFTVLTYNVNWGGPGADLAVKAVQDSGADIVCLQETTPDWERYLRPRLEATYPHILFRHHGGAGGQAFLSKFTLKEIAYVRPSAGWFPGWIVEALTPVGRVQILNVHLRPALSDRGSVTPSAYYSTKSVRLTEIQGFHRRLDHKRPHIVLGDFNEDDGGRVITWLAEQGMTDALSQFDRSTPTWEWRTSLVTLRDRLDHIAYSRHLHCYGAKVIRAGASDHFPVLAVFGPKK